jgi:hypothetical protein
MQHNHVANRETNARSVTHMRLIFLGTVVDTFITLSH